MNKKDNCLTQAASASNSLYNFFKKKNPNGQDNSHQACLDQKESPSMNENTNNTYASVQPHVSVQQFHEQDNSNAIDFYNAKKMIASRGHPIFNEDSNHQNCSQTQPIKQKIKLLPSDELDTRKVNEIAKAAIQKEIKKQTAVQQTQKKDKIKRNKKLTSKIKKGSQNQDISVSIEIPPSQKIEQILQKQPLRTRFSALLKDDQKYSIGQQHMKILKILRSMDTNIQFMAQARKNKYYFFADIKKSLYEVSRMELSLKHLQQLLFLDEGLYTVEWQMNQKINNYDLMIISPEIRSEDQRIQNTRKKIVNYLLALELQFLSERQREKFSVDGWAQGFNPNNYELPLKNLPTHPFAKQATLRELSNSQISSVKNPNLKRFMKQIKDQQDCKSFRSEDVASMIFAKSTSCIKQKLYEAIRQKQARKQQQINTASENVIDKDVVSKICDSIMLIYMSKGVSNIFKVTLIETLNKKTTYKSSQILQSLGIILAAKHIQFLKEITTSNKTEVVQVNKSKFNEMMQFLKN